jgi:hypothetical protein
MAGTENERYATLRAYRRVADQLESGDHHPLLPRTLIGHVVREELKNPDSPLHRMGQGQGETPDPVGPAQRQRGRLNSSSPG